MFCRRPQGKRLVRLPIGSTGGSTSGNGRYFASRKMPVAYQMPLSLSRMS